MLYLVMVLEYRVPNVLSSETDFPAFLPIFDTLPSLKKVGYSATAESLDFFLF